MWLSHNLFFLIKSCHNGDTTAMTFSPSVNPKLCLGFRELRWKISGLLRPNQNGYTDLGAPNLYNFPNSHEWFCLKLPIIISHANISLFLLVLYLWVIVEATWKEGNQSNAFLLFQKLICIPLNTSLLVEFYSAISRISANLIPPNISLMWVLLCLVYREGDWGLDGLNDLSKRNGWSCLLCKDPWYNIYWIFIMDPALH